MTRKKYIAGTLMGIIGAISSALYGTTVEQREEFSFTRPLGSGEKITVENVNGSITVTGVDGLGEVVITGAKIVKAGSADEATAHLKDIAIDIGDGSTGLRVVSVHPEGSGGRNYSVQYEIKVPSNWTVQATNTNGLVSVQGVRGDVKAEVTNGDLQARDLDGSVDARVTNGRVYGDLSVPASGSCVLQTTNGQINARIAVSERASCSVTAVNGQVELALPSATSASIAAHSSIGSVSVANLPLQQMERVRENFVGERLSGRLGSGGGRIDVSVENGEIALKGDS